jgi:phosphatidylinositol alpha-mannosyltransferase
LRVAIVSPYSWAHPGGVNNHIEGLAGQLLKRGHDVTIVAPDEGRQVDGASFESAGRSVPVPANGSIARLALAPGTGRRVRKLVAGGGYDVVHVHEPMVPMVSTSAVTAAPRRVVGTFHAAGEGGSFTYFLGKTLMGRVPRRLDFRIAVSEPARLLASRYLPGEYEIVPNGVDVSRFAPSCSEGGATRAPEILFVGRNERRKGLGLLLEAFPMVCDSVPGCRLKVIGSGFTEAGVKAALPVDAGERVEVLGFVGNEELPAHYAWADVFCAPALGGESFGVVLIESMASGTPVVASDIPGYSAVVKQAGGGILFRSGEAQDLARALVEVLRDEVLRGRLRERGLEGVRQFSWERLVPRLESIYSGKAPAG